MTTTSEAFSHSLFLAHHLLELMLLLLPLSSEDEQFAEGTDDHAEFAAGSLSTSTGQMVYPYLFIAGKCPEGSNANTGLRVPVSNLRVKKDALKVRTHFGFASVASEVFSSTGLASIFPIASTT